MPRPRDLPSWVRPVRAGRRPGGRRGRARLVEIVGDATALATEVEKLAAWSAGEQIGRREVELLAAPAQEASAWAIMDAWGARDLPVRWPPASRTSSTARPLRDRYAPLVPGHSRPPGSGAPRGGPGAKDIAKRLRKHEFRVRKALGHAENYTRDELDEAVIRLAALDAGSRAPAAWPASWRARADDRRARALPSQLRIASAAWPPFSSYWGTPSHHPLSSLTRSPRAWRTNRDESVTDSYRSLPRSG